MSGSKLALNFYQVIHLLVALAHLCLGAAFALSPATRFSTPSWEPLLNITDGQLWPWAVAIGASGALMLDNRVWSDMIGCFLGIAWHSFLAALFVVAILESPEASATGPFAYGLLMAVNGALLTQRVIDWTHPTRNGR